MQNVPAITGLHDDHHAMQDLPWYQHFGRRPTDGMNEVSQRSNDCFLSLLYDFLGSQQTTVIKRTHNLSPAVAADNCADPSRHFRRWLH